MQHLLQLSATETTRRHEPLGIADQTCCIRTALSSEYPCDLGVFLPVAELHFSGNKLVWEALANVWSWVLLCHE